MVDVDTSVFVPLSKPVCSGCNKTPSELNEYIEAAADNNEDPDTYVRLDEGTYNESNGHFLCTPCYVRAGCPTAPDGWVTP